MVLLNVVIFNKIKGIPEFGNSKTKGITEFGNSKTQGCY